MTVGEMREVLKDLPSNMKILTITHNHMELGSSLVDNECHPTVARFSKEKKTVYDAFDGDVYYTDVYERDETHGEECLLL